MIGYMIRNKQTGELFRQKNPDTKLPLAGRIGIIATDFPRSVAGDSLPTQDVIVAAMFNGGLHPRDWEIVEVTYEITGVMRISIEKSKVEAE
jgi:hypothetical protein